MHDQESAPPVPDHLIATAKEGKEKALIPQIPLSRGKRRVAECEKKYRLEREPMRKRKAGGA